jgi:hypothetical protein
VIPIGVDIVRLATVMVEGALCASKTAPGLTSKLLVTVMAASGTTSQKPAIVILEYVPVGILPPVHVYE